jgi:hypothetical protein
LQHGELVSEQGDLGEQRPARAKRVRKAGGGHQDGFENERKSNADALDFSLIAQVAMTAPQSTPGHWIHIDCNEYQPVSAAKPPSERKVKLMLPGGLKLDTPVSGALCDAVGGKR